MIKYLANLIRTANSDEESIHIIDLRIEDKSTIEYLKDLNQKNCIEDYFDTDNLTIGNTISFDLNWDELQPLGVYKSWTRFIDDNQYKQKEHYYIKDLDCHESSQNFIIKVHRLIIRFISLLMQYAEYSFDISGSTHIVLSQNSQSTVINLKYNSEDVNNLVKSVPAINEYIDALSKKNEKQCLFLNEIIEFTKTIDDSNKRFSSILSNIGLLNKKATNAYDFYLSAYSYNKLKMELDTKALNYTHQLQNVINESQTKLIAIPTAFVLAVANLDFGPVLCFSGKNIGIILSLYLFAILIQLFVNNQKNILSFIELDIKEYKDMFMNQDVEKVSKRFSDVEKVLKTQKRRFCIIEFLLWLLPIALTLYVIFSSISLTLFSLLKILLFFALPLIILTITIIVN